MTSNEIKELINFIVNTGTPVVITAGFLWTVWKYVPVYFDNRIAVEKQQADSILQFATALKEVAAALALQNRQSSLANRQLRTLYTSLRHASLAAEKYIDHHQSQSGVKLPSDVIRNLQNMRNAGGFANGETENDMG